MFAKFKFTMVCAGLIALVACWASPASANLLLDPGFEGPNAFSNTEPWVPFTFTSSTTKDTTGTNAHTGTNAAIEVGGTATTGSTGIFQQIDNVLPGTSFTLTAWAKADVLPISSDDTYGGAVMRVVFEELGGADIDSTTAQLALGPTGVVGVVRTGNGLLATTYQQFSVTGIAPAGTEQIKVQLYSRHSDRAIFFDDIDLTSILPMDTPAFGVTIDRATGNISLENVGTGTGTIKEIKITSASGALDPLNWKSVAGNYDTSGGTSNGSVDGNDAWTRQVETNFELTEDETVGDGGILTVGQVVDLGDNAWIKSIQEDLSVTVTQGDDTVSVSSVTFTGGPTGAAFERSDLNFDGAIDAVDWPILRDNLLTDLSSLPEALAYQQGDVNGDGSNNIADFRIFKADFDAANGLGAFEALVAGVPEPSSVALLALGVLGLSISRKRRVRSMRSASCLLALVLVVGTVAPSYAVIDPIDFTTFTTVDDYPLIENNNSNFPTYTTTTTTATLDTSANPHALYGTQSILNKRITGKINPGVDDDMVGLLLGYTAGDTTRPVGSPGGAADFLLLDWKGLEQFFDFEDDFIASGPPTFQDFHNTTQGSTAQRGLALSRVTGTPTGDELWAHRNANLPGIDDENLLGGVAQLQRGATLGAKSYTDNFEHLFDITYTATNIIVKVDGVEQINVSGTFPDGVLALYSMAQQTTTSPPVYSDFTISDLDDVLTATVNTLSGNVTLSNATSSSFDLDIYTLESPSSSLEFSSWNSLEDQDLAGFAAGDGSGNGWEESTNSSDAALSEASLITVSAFGTTTSISLGNAFDTAGSQDLVFTYSDPSGLVTTGVVEYVSTVEDANFDGDTDVDGGDFLTWQRGFGLTGQTDNSNGDANGSGIVDGVDLTAWENQFGTTGLLSGAQAVPEPSSALLLILAAFGLGLSRRQTS